MAKRQLVWLLACLPGTAEVLAQGMAIEEIIVTSRKTEESVQDIPLSVQAFSRDELRAANIESLTDLANATPGLSYDSLNAGSSSAPIIRGLAQLNAGGFDIQASNNVGRFIDGIYQTSRQNADLEMIDIEMIEVIKGPASALYGRSTFAGAINVITRKPTSEFEGELEVGVGIDEDYLGRLTLSGPLTDTLGGRIKLGYRTFDGTIENQADSGDNLQGYEQRALTGSLWWDTTENWVNTLTAYYSDRDEEHSGQYLLLDKNCSDMGYGNQYYCGNARYSDDVSISPDAYGSETRSWQLSFKSEYYLDGLIFTGIMSLAETDAEGVFDQDYTAAGQPHNVWTGIADTATLLSMMLPPGTPLPPLPSFMAQTGTIPDGTVLANAYSISDSENSDKSLELRLQSDNDSAFSWLAGLYWFESDATFSAAYGVDNRGLAADQTFFSFLDGFQGAATTLPALAATANPVQGNLITYFDSDVETFSVFGRVMYDLSAAWRVSADLRYEEETKTLNSFLNNGVPGSGESENTWYSATPRVSIDYTFANDAMVYLTVGKGLRSGGINAAYSAAFPDEAFYDEETNTTYEIGLKSSWLDQRMQVNLALYSIDWDDIQISGLSEGPGTLGQIIRNVGSATSKGLELQVDAVVSRLLTVGMAYAYNDATFDSGSQDLGARARCGFDTCDLIPTGLTSLGRPIFIPDVSGKQLPKTAKNQFSAHATLSGLIGEWDWSVRADYRYQDDAYLDTVNLLKYGKRNLLDMRVAFENEQWSLVLWGTNLTDAEYVTAGAYQPRSFTGLDYAFDFVQSEGRRMGVSAAYRF